MSVKGHPDRRKKEGVDGIDFYLKNIPLDFLPLE